jgi:caffeoyl-CoA O-methyltransferase
MNPIVPVEIDAYAEAHTTPPAEHLQRVAEATRAELPGSVMLTGTVEGRFLETLVYLTQPRLILEIGTYSGYSAQSMAATLPPDGRIITCELLPLHVNFAREHLEAGPYADRIEIRQGPALETIASLDGPFDLVFIDADKAGYRDYYEAVLPKLAPRGLIVADNTLYSGQVVDLAADASDTAREIAAFNDHVTADPRVVNVLLTIRDGVTLIRRAQTAA